jgi:hypothetical protein
MRGCVLHSARLGTDPADPAAGDGRRLPCTAVLPSPLDAARLAGWYRSGYRLRPAEVRADVGDDTTGEEAGSWAAPAGQETAPSQPRATWSWLATTEARPGRS